MPVAHCNGIDIYYERSGDGPRLLFFNGSGATLETSVPNVFIAGVVVAGFDANKVFIENGRYHGDKIVARLLGRRAPAEPKLSAELDT